MSPNNPNAAKAAVAVSLHAEGQCRGLADSDREATTMYLLFFLPVLFVVAVLCARATPSKTRMASKLLAVIAVLWGGYTVMFWFAAAWVGGWTGSSGDPHPLVFAFGMFGGIPYCLWVAVSISKRGHDYMPHACLVSHYKPKSE